MQVLDYFIVCQTSAAAEGAQVYYLYHTSAYVSIRQHTYDRHQTHATEAAQVSYVYHTSAYVSIRQHMSAYVTQCYKSAYCYICVLILLYMCPHSAIYVSSYCYMCPQRYICVLILPTYVSSYCDVCVLILLHMCPHITIYVSSCCYVS